ncbi:MAG: phosphatidate cytidylyltransferase [Anaerolineae bacterium]
MLLTRVLTAAVLLPIVLGAIYLGGPWLAGLLALFLGIAYYEFANLMGEEGMARGPFAIGMVLVVLLAWNAYWAEDALTAPLVTFAFLLSLAWQILQRGQVAPATLWCVSMAGAVYLGWLGRYVVLLREMPQGLQWLLLALLTTWITDSAAYFIGRRFGRHRMAPRLSPRKTWEGAVGGWVVGVFGGLVVGDFLGLGWAHGLAVGALASTVAPFGDLAVSVFKRQVGVKDTGHLLPGHGGMWDRLDSPLFVVPTVYFYALWFGT